MRLHPIDRHSKKARRAPVSRRRLLQMERLEDRQLLATFTVDSTADSGTGTLRQAILDAAMNDEADTIDFDASLAGETITLTSNDSDTAYGLTALVINNDNITIDGSNAPLLTLSGNGARRIFAVSSTATLTLENITLTDGLAQGGDGYGGSSGSSGAGGGGGGGAGLGGAIFNEGTLNVVQSTLSGNTAIGGSSILEGTQFGGGGGGSAAYNGGVGADYGGGGGGGVGGAGAGASGNSGGSGGANQSGTQASEGSSGTLGGGGGGGNKAVAGGSGTAASDSGFGGGGGGGGGETTNVNGGAGGSGGFGAGGGGGGGAESNDGTGGAGGAGGFGGGGGGGGIYSYDGDTGAAGVGGFGGGNGAGGGTSSGGKKGGGGAGMGGAIFNDGGTVTITNSTLTGNTAQGGTGANNGEGLGGAIFSLNGTLNTLNATISINTANAGDGVYLYADNATATATINNTIIGQSTNTTSDFAASANGEGTDSTSGVGNLIRSATNFSGSIVSTGNPLLGSLADSTGPTETMLPTAGSPAIDAGNNAAVSDLTTDQRGLPRISNSIVDIGSVEVQSSTAPTITSADDTTFTVGSAGTFSITTTGNPTAALSESGALPGGVSFVDNGNGTATLSGTPTSGSSGTYTLSLTASNGVEPDGTQTFTLTVDQAPAITSDDGTTFTVGSAGTFTITTSGFPTASLSESGALPSGVTFLDNGEGTATINGTPASGTGGTYTLSITAANGVTPEAEQTFTLTVDQAPAITSDDATTFTVGSAGTFSITTSGFPTASLSESGALPGGVTFLDNGDGTATLSGTPTSGIGGTYTLSLTAANGVTPEAEQTFTLTVDQAPAITSDDATTFTVGNFGTFTVTTTGFPDPALSESGALPGGVTFLDNGEGTATINGTPASGTGGTYTLSITAANGVTPEAEQTFTLTVDQAPAITSDDATTFTVGSEGTFSITTGGFPTASLSESGALPGGVTFLDNGDGTATLSGTPTSGTSGTYTLSVTATNGITPDATQTFTLTVDQAPAITSDDATTFTVGSAGTFSITTSGFPTAALSETGSLPGGVTFLDNGNGTATLSGTPAAGSGGTYTLSLTATNGVAPDATQTFTLTVDQAPAITSDDATTFAVGSAGTFSITTSGFPGTSLSESGALPGGVTFLDNGDGTATLSGTPDAGSGGTYMLSLTATNGVAPDATQTFTLTVNQSPAITSDDATTFTVGNAGTFSITTSGFPTAALSESGTLPGGVSFLDNGDGTATLSGTPDAGSGGTYTLSLTATNGVAPDATQTFTLTVDQAPAITSDDATTFAVGSAGTFSITTSGFPGTSLSESGALPGSVTFLDNGDGTATLSGTPDAGSGGTYMLSLTATNGVAPDATQTFTLTVDQAPAITSDDATTFTVGSAGTFTITTSGFPIATLSESGALPGGVTFLDNGNGTATLSGTPTSGTGGTYTLSLTAANGVTPEATQTFTLTVDQAPAITSDNADTFTVGSAGTFSITTTGFPNATLSESGALPGGVTFLDNDNGTATISGTPAAGSGGTYTLSITAANGITPDAGQTFTLTVDQAPAITSDDDTTFIVGSAGTFTITTGGFPTASLSESDALPGGVTFLDNGDGTATLSGMPTSGTGGTYTLSITAANGVMPEATQTFTLTVDQAPAITSDDDTTFTVGSAGTFSITSTGFPTAALSESGTLPGGVTFLDNGDGTATLGGTPAAGSGGTYTLSITASNGVTPDAEQTFTLTVDQAPAITSNNGTTFTVGSAGTFSITTTGFPNAALSESGTLPGGVSFVDNGGGTATLSGTPAAGSGGTYTLSITASNGVEPDATQSFTLTVDQAPAITSDNGTTFTVGSAGTFSITATGFLNAALSESGTLPGGVTFLDNENGTATLSGTPAAGSGGTYTLSITASNGVEPDATQTFTLTVDQAPAITSDDDTTFAVGSAGTFSITSTGFPTAALSESGTLPGGVTFLDNGDGTATLGGTPAAGSGGTYTLSLTASNGVTPEAEQTFTLTVDQAPAITSDNGTTFTVGSAGTFSITTTGFPNAALSESGTLPGGVTFLDNGDGTATLGGTPAAGSGGTYTLSLTASNGVTPEAEQTFTLTVDQAPAITSDNGTTFTVGSAGTFSITTTGFPNAALSESGALPGGVSFVDNENGTATLGGTPTSGSGGTYTLSIMASNGVEPEATQTFTLTVDQAPAITSTNSSTFTVGSAGTFSITTSGFPNATLSESGALPGGVTFLDNGDGTAILSGTPAAGTVGVFTLILTSSNGVAPDASQDFILTVAAANSATTVNASSSQSVYGQLLTFSAHVSASDSGIVPSGIVIFQEDNTVLDRATLDPSGNATFSTDTLAVGSHTITASYSGDANFNPSTATPLVHTVNPAPSIVTAQPSTSATSVGEPVTFTATISAPPGTGTPTGTVTFMDGNTVLGTAPVNPVGLASLAVTSPSGGAPTNTALGTESLDEDGYATLTVPSLSAGAHTITAVYSGDATHAPSTTAVADVVIVAPSPNNEHGPTVVGLARYGYHAQPTYLVVYFDGPLSGSSAQRASNYKVAGPIKHPGAHEPIIVTSATYNPANDTVTLAFNRRFNLHYHYRLTINGTAPSGITNPSNVPLNAAVATQSGRDYVVKFGPKILAGSARERTSLGHTMFSFHGKGTTSLSHVAVHHLLSKDVTLFHRRRPKA